MSYLFDFVILILIYECIFYKRWKEQGTALLLYKTSFYLYICLLAYATLMPVCTNFPNAFHHAYHTMNLNPFIDVAEHHLNAVQEVELNILIMVPMGIFLADLYHMSMPKAILTAFLVSLFIELFQPFISTDRISDITDIINNTCGAAIGYLLSRLWTAIRKRRGNDHH